MVARADDRQVTTVKFQLNLSPDERDRLAAYVQRENERLAPARLTMTDVIRAAITAYLAARQDQSA